MSRSAENSRAMSLARAAFSAFVLWIPVETIVVIKTDGSGHGITVARLLGVLLFGLALIDWRRCFRRIPLAFWMIAWYLVVYSISQLGLPGALDAQFREEQMTLIQMAVLFLITANLFSDAEFRCSIFRLYGWWIGLVAAGTFLGIFGDQFTAGRDTIVGQDPNVAASFFACGAICLLGDARLLWGKRFLPRLVLALLAVGALLAAILRTGSRGGLTVFGAGILGLAVCGGRKTRMRRAVIASAVLAMLGLQLAREYSRGTTTSVRLTASWEEGNTAGRTAIYNEAWAMFKERPLLGYGGANNFAVLGVRLNEVSPAGYYYRDTHNLLLALLTEVGLIGAAPFIIAFLCALWASWRHGERTDDVLPFALMCAQILVNTSLTGYHQKLFWIVLAAAVSCGLEPERAVAAAPDALGAGAREASTA